MNDTRVGRNDPCPCGSGKKFKKCCLLRQANGPPGRNGIGPGPQLAGSSSRGPAEPGSPTFWSHPPGQPDVPPPAGGEWVEYVFVKDKGWTHESELKPGDQYRLKGGGWGTVEPERVIGTTQEHPFYVQGKGWTPLAEIRPGDWIRTDNGWVQVKDIRDTGRYETVYNLRVADYHTYFVGGEDWGFGVWAHNAYVFEKSEASSPLHRRAIEMHRDGLAGQPDAFRRRAVGAAYAIGPDGKKVTLIADSSSTRLHPDQRALLAAGEVEVRVPHRLRSLHAEEKIKWFAEQNGYQLTDIAASKPICMERCFPTIPNGVRIHTPTQAEFDQGIRRIEPYIKGS